MFTSMDKCGDIDANRRNESKNEFLIGSRLIGDSRSLDLTRFSAKIGRNLPNENPLKSLHMNRKGRPINEPT